MCLITFRISKKISQTEIEEKSKILLNIIVIELLNIFHKSGNQHKCSNPVVILCLDSYFGSPLIRTYLHDEPYLIVFRFFRGSSAINSVEIREIRMTGEIAKYTILLHDQALRLGRKFLNLNSDSFVSWNTIDVYNYHCALSLPVISRLAIAYRLADRSLRKHRRILRRRCNLSARISCLDPGCCPGA